MPADIIERYGFSILTRSTIEYVDGAGPRNGLEARKRADLFKEKLDGIFGELTDHPFTTRTVYAREGSLETAHLSDFKFAAYEDWIRIQDMFFQFFEDMEDWLETEWKLQEGGQNVYSARVTVSPPSPRGVSVSKKAAEQMSQRQAARRSTAPLEDGAQRAQMQRENNRRMNRMNAAALSLGLALGIIGTSAAAAYFSLQQEVHHLAEAVKLQPAPEATEDRAPVSVFCQPNQTCRGTSVRVEGKSAPN